jgi:hypothetical protein
MSDVPTVLTDRIGVWVARLLKMRHLVAHLSHLLLQPDNRLGQLQLKGRNLLTISEEGLKDCREPSYSQATLTLGASEQHWQLLKPSVVLAAAS